jgi:hypothetical protein
MENKERQNYLFFTMRVAVIKTLQQFFNFTLNNHFFCDKFILLLIKRKTWRFIAPDGHL